MIARPPEGQDLKSFSLHVSLRAKAKVKVAPAHDRLCPRNETRATAVVLCIFVYSPKNKQKKEKREKNTFTIKQSIPLNPRQHAWSNRSPPILPQGSCRLRMFPSLPFPPRSFLTRMLPRPWLIESVIYPRRLSPANATQHPS